MTVTGPCVSLSTGTYSDDLRVRYSYGMVLGLDDFIQEQRYFLQKDYLHERALHGYGTVYGLHVTAAPSTDDPTDVTVTVLPGMAIDQWGREVVVRSAQCARLGAWLAAQEEAEPGTIAAHRDADGNLIVYVVISYTDCPDDLVPLPGQPCSTSDEVTVASRLRDSWDIELRWTPPWMPAWDVDRHLAQLITGIEVVPGLDPSQSDEAAIIEAVQALGDSTPPELPVGPTWKLPEDGAADAFDAIFTVWVTQVRPRLAPWLTNPATASDPAILLSAIEVGADTSDATADPIPVTTVGDPDDTGRPYVLHTRLLQELRWHGGTAASAATPMELATVESLVTGGDLLLTAWFHLAQPVAITTPVTVTNSAGTSAQFTATADDAFSQVWTLNPPDGGFAVNDGDLLAITFAGDATQVGDATTTLAAVQTGGVVLLDAQPSGDVTVYSQVRAQDAPVVTPAAVVDFVTVTQVPLLKLTTGIGLELWFHTPVEWPQPAVTIAELEERVVIFDEVTGQQLQTPVIQQDSDYGNLWHLDVQRPDTKSQAYLRLIFLAPKIPVEGDDGGQLLLLDWMHKAQVTYLGWDGGETITAYIRVPLDTLSVHGNETAQPARKAAATKTTARKSAAKKTARKAPARKAPARKTPARKTPAKKAARGGRR